MIIDFDRLILLVSSTLILAYVSDLFYAKTKIPDIIWLLAIGIFLGPVTSVFQKDLFISLSPLMSTIALSIILFDAGLNLDIRMLLESISKAAAISVASIFSAIVALGLLMHQVMPEFTNLEGMLLGAMIGGTSTVAIFSVLSSLERQLPNIETTRTILLMESVISDPICIISSITLIKMIMLPQVSIIDSFVEIVFMFVYSSLFGLGFGLIWSGVLSILRHRRFNNMITLAVLFLIYIMAETVMGKGGGVMTALTFGLTVANSNWILSALGLRLKLMVDTRQLREFHDEITFFIKAFFFVYIGLIVTISRQYFIVGLGVFVLLQALRYGVLTSLSPFLSLTRQELLLSRVIYASGLPAFIMSQLPMLMDPGREHASPEVYPNLTMPIVIFTLLFASLAGPYIVERQLRSPGVET
jgi:cell volume regulation protein A